MTMPLKTYTEQRVCDFPKKIADAELTPVFRLANADDTVNLGRAFADAARDMRAMSRAHNAAIRIGIMGIRQTGKTSFVRGLLSALHGYELKEENCRHRLQQSLHHEKHGWLRHYDASLNGASDSQEWALPSYLNNDLSDFGLPFLDIAEHAGHDIHNKNFHSLIYLDAPRGTYETSRLLRIRTSPDIMQSNGFASFLRQAAPYSASQRYLPKEIYGRAAKP